MESGTIHQTTQHVVHIQRTLMVDGNDTVQFIGREEWLLRTKSVVFVFVKEVLNTKVSNDRSADLVCVLLRLGQMVRDSRFLAMEVRTAKLLISNDFTRCSLNERRTSQENSASLLHHHDLIRHGWHVSTTGCATSHHHSDLGNAFSRHACLIKEDPSEMFAVWEHIILFREESASTIN